MGISLENALPGMILSASGWRAVFAEDGNEESAAPAVAEAHRIIAAAAAKVFSDYISQAIQAGPVRGSIIVGRDTRPTGEAVADAIIRALLAEKWDVTYTGISAAPEIMAFTRAASAADGKTRGFIYISASHNPIGHNGIKFGLTDGGVIQASENALLSAAFRAFMESPDCVENTAALLKGAGAEKLSEVYAQADKNKKAALASYRDFTGEVISGHDDIPAQENFFSIVRRELEKEPVGVAADFNGSARTVSIDRDFLSAAGVRFYSLNDKPGEIAHRIVPEGHALAPCCAYIEGLRKKDSSVTLGYVPDCDGDRGNLVIWDDGKNRARILEAQEVFALSCVAELSYLAWTGRLRYDSKGKALVKAAIAVNDPTSLRIDRIARAFDVSVFRAEVGEANVVGLARKLREQGYMVRVLGEGSAGGTIIHPSAVRDPLNTLGAILKLLSLRNGGAGEFSGMGLFEIWLRLSGQPQRYRNDFTLADIISTLPAFITTGMYSENALLQVKTSDHGLLKQKYQDIFRHEWEEKKKTLHERFGISAWEAIAYNGTEERRNIRSFAEAGRGGLKIVFTGNGVLENAESIACIWMRGSGTEPVFRVMAEGECSEGGGSAGELEKTLIEWQRKMVLKADEAVSALSNK